jgi:hypothetical protein
MSNLHAHLDGVAKLLQRPQQLLKLRTAHQRECLRGENHKQAQTLIKPKHSVTTQHASTCEVFVAKPTSSSNHATALANAAEHASRCASHVTAFHSMLSSSFSRIMYLHTR